MVSRTKQGHICSTAFLPFACSVCEMIPFGCPKTFSSLLNNIRDLFSLKAFKVVYIQHKHFSLHFCLATSFINAGLSVFIYCLRLFSLVFSV